MISSISKFVSVDKKKKVTLTNIRITFSHKSTTRGYLLLYSKTKNILGYVYDTLTVASLHVS